MRERTIVLASCLPLEILSLIFLYGFEDGIDPRKPFKRRELESELNFEVRVSHVCRYWREVALRTPALWTGIRLRKPAHLERGRVFVERSRNQPLDILLDTVSEADYEPGHRLGIAEFDAGFAVAIEHTDRWRSLIVKVCDLPCKERARANLRDCPPVPHLETLQLWHVQDWTDAANMLHATRKPPIPILSDFVPCLRNASLVGVNLAYPQTHYLVGLRQLELALHAEYCRPTSSEFESILRACPALERLSLHYSGPRVDGSVPETAPAVRLEALSELALTNMDVDVVAHVVRRLAMPRLRSLELDLPALQEALDFTPVIDWLASPSAPAFPSLEELFVADLACELGPWARWLATMRELKRLQVNFDVAGQAFFDPLLEKPPAPSPASTSVPAHTEVNNMTDDASSPAAPPPSSSSPSPVHTVHTRTTTTTSAVLLPSLEHLKIQGLPSARLRKLAEFRRARLGRDGVPHFHVHLKSVDEDTDKLEDDGYAVTYFGVKEVLEGDVGDEEDEDGEDGESEVEDEDEEGDDGEEEEEGVESATGELDEGEEAEEEEDGTTRVGDDEPTEYAADDDDDDDEENDDEHTKAGSIDGGGSYEPSTSKIAATTMA